LPHLKCHFMHPQIGGCVRPDGICEFSSIFRLASESDILHILRSMHIRDLRPRG
jgi:hypothetical protein